MPTLPTSGLAGTAVNDHIAHHEGLHDLNNKLVNSAAVGTVLMRDSTSAAVSALTPKMPFFTYPSQCQTVSHASAGPLSFTVTAATKAVRVNAAANITDITVAGMADLGPWGLVWVRLVASASITLAFSSAIVVGGAPATLAAGQSTVFCYQSWDF